MNALNKKSAGGRLKVLFIFLMLAAGAAAAVYFRLPGRIEIRPAPAPERRPQIQVSSWLGRVIKVEDGDSLTVEREGRPCRIRLYGLDAPEKGQAFGQKAKENLSRLARGPVRVEPLDEDQYGRQVALVYDQSGRSLNQAQIEDGWAWVYPGYCRKDFCQAWREAEARARDASLGLWREAEPVPPWQWRKKKRSARPAPG